jgi:hypothetical protein
MVSFRGHAVSCGRDSASGFAGAEVRIQVGGALEHGAVAERGPALVFGHNLHLQRNKSFMPLGDQLLEWWSAGAITGTHLGDRYAFLASALGTVGDNTPPPDTIEGILSTFPWDHSLIDARRLAEAITKPAPRISRDFAYFPLDPAQLDMIDGVVFLKQDHR